MAKPSCAQCTIVNLLRYRGAAIVLGRDDGAYWAAALVLAHRANDQARARLAHRRLRRLGYRFELARPELQTGGRRGQ